MKMNISIIGCCGSGKTFLADKLGSLLNIPVFHMDSYYWRENWTHVDEEEFESTILGLADNHSGLIIEGLYLRFLPERLNSASTIIYLDYPSIVCFFRVLCRQIKYFGKVRPDMEYPCVERIDLRMLKNILLFNHRYRNRFYHLLADYHEKDIVILHNRREVNEFLRNCALQSETFDI